jgi:hypothetical protein
MTHNPTIEVDTSLEYQGDITYRHDDTCPDASWVKGVVDVEVRISRLEV